MPAIDLTADELSVLKTLLSFHSDDEPEAYYPAAPFDSLKTKVESAKKSDDEIAEAIAITFRTLIRAALPPQTCRLIDRRNASPSYKAHGSCATHDFVDANVVMEEAFKRNSRDVFSALGEIDADVCALWGKAWDIAKEKGFGTE